MPTVIRKMQPGSQITFRWRAVAAVFLIPTEYYVQNIWRMDVREGVPLLGGKDLKIATFKN